MPRVASFEPIKKTEGWMINIPNSMTPDGRRIRRFFPTRDEARGFAEKMEAQYKNEGVAALGLSASERVMASKALDLIRDAKIDDLLEVVREGIKVISMRQKSLPFGQVFDGYIASKKRSDIYTQSLKRSRKRLGGLGDKLISDISPEILEEQLLGLGSTYRNSLLRELRAVFGFAVRRKWCAENPVKSMDFGSHHVGEREIFSVKECSQLLAACQKTHPDMIPAVAIGLFAGVRIYEVLRMTWSNVDLRGKMIDLPADITKRKRKRSIPIEPALRAWLLQAAPTADVRSGPIAPMGSYTLFRDRIRLLAAHAKVTWKQNAMRHSYASYWLEQHKDLNRLAIYLGHIGGLDVLQRFYHRSVRYKDAKAFWALRPKKIG